jgi:drug/metabolite transporter (DMT)-like permease
LPADNQNKLHHARGYLFIAAAAFLWGAAATLGKAAFKGAVLSRPELPVITPLILAQTRVSISVLVLLPALFLMRKQIGMPLRDALRCMMLGVAGLAGSNFFYYYAIEKTTVATAIIVQYSAPVWVLLYMIARGIQKPTLQRVASVVLAVAGSVLAIFAIGTQLRVNLLGVLAALGAAFSFAFYNVYGHELLTRYDQWRTILYAMAGAGIFWLFINPPWKIARVGYAGAQWGFLALFAIISMLLPFSFYFAGLKHLDATRAIVTSCLEPIFATTLAAVFVQEPLGWFQGLGVACVVAAILIIQQPRDEEVGAAAQP